MKKHIICFGDSNTHGYDGITGGRFDEDRRWTTILGKLLGDDYLVIEEGLGGRTTCFDDPLTEGLSGISVINPCLMSHEPVDLLIIMLGTNDTKHRFGVEAPEIAISMQRLIRKAKATDCWKNEKPNILLITPKNIDKEYETSIIEPGMGHGCAEKSQKLPEEFKKIAEIEDVHYLDANNIVSNNNHVDYMHIDEKGHRQLAEALAEVIKEMSL